MDLEIGHLFCCIPASVPGLEDMPRYIYTAEAKMHIEKLLYFLSTIHLSGLGAQLIYEDLQGMHGGLECPKA